MIKPDNPIKSYSDYYKSKFTIEKIIESGKGDNQTNYFKITENFTAMMNDLLLLLKSLESGTLTRDEFISVVETSNKIIDDAETFNLQIIQELLNDTNPFTREEFAIDNNIREEDIPVFKYPGYNVPAMKKSLNDAIDEGFKKIHDEWLKNPKQPQTTILTHNNDPDGSGRHISLHNVNISSVIALHLVCDAIEGSYQINLKQSNQAQQGYILYSFAPTAPPGFLIVEDPINPVYMRCHNISLTRINFRLSDQANNLIDL